jgi:putative FmdB family regulatory protein
MPIYEYFCSECRQRVSVFFRSMRAAEEGKACCPQCGSLRLTRMVSRVNRLKSDEQRLEGLATPELMSGLEQEDSRALAAFMRGMSNELGDPLDAEMEDAVERWEAGAPLGEVERPSQEDTAPEDLAPDYTDAASNQDA